MPSTPPPFEVIGKVEARGLRKPRRERRDWKPITDALVAGRDVFIAEPDISDANVKYLTLVLHRRGKGERLRTQRIARDGVEGRQLWVDFDAAPVAHGELDEQVPKPDIIVAPSHSTPDDLDLIRKGL